MFVSRRRRFALVAAVAALGASAWWFTRLFQQPPAQWSGSALLGSTLLSAVGNAILWMEIVRMLSSRLSRWSDPIHFNWVGILGFAVFVVQYIGLRLVMGAYDN